MRLNVSQHVSALIAAITLAAVVAPVGLAGAADGSRASASANASVVKTLQKLKKQVGVLRAQVVALEGQNGTPRQPSGPAGGDLTGTFPNPLVGPNAIGTLEIQANSIGNTELQDSAVGTAEIADGGVGFADIVNGSVDGLKIADETVGSGDIGQDSVGSSELAFNSVGSSELAQLTAVVSGGTTISAAGGPDNAAITCPAGRTLVDGGFAWLDEEANSIITSAPSEADPNSTWVVRGMVDAGSNRLFAWATCLAG